MPRIQSILSQGGTSSNDFTLHDIGHAFRVAKRMSEIVPPDVFEALSEYELGLMILSAYLHDIGMTPERRNVSLHYQYLLTGDPQTLSQHEIHHFQKWLDESGRDICPPLTTQGPTPKDLQLAEQIITLYSRHKHNDWGESWIRSNIVKLEFGNYASWIDDLVTLCRSHHHGYHELRTDTFSPKVVDEPCVVVHLRYLACVLRIADILEFDPERTPEVIFQHRSISQTSSIFWWKDHHIRPIIEAERIALFAEPPSAYIHKAIEVMAEDINQELSICRALADETHFDVGPGITHKLKHRWDLAARAYLQIKPVNNSYVYIDGAFRPNTRKLLELLSGIELYGSALVAVRELLQNAFDAVREQIAYERLRQENPSDPELENTLGQLHTVSLQIESRSDGIWLVCRDNGVGMTMPIIKDHLLVSGSAKRHDVLELERKCKARGFELGRTGQFGIGVLSYFLIADRMFLQTRRSQSPGDSEQAGWHFETEGVGSFGELRKIHRDQHGTDLHLHLRPEAIGPNPSAWCESLFRYVDSILQRIPCRFELISSLPGFQTYKRNAGWIHSADEFAIDMIEEMAHRRLGQQDNTPLEYLPVSKKLLRESQDRELEELRNKIRASLRWIIKEDLLPGQLGRYRVHLPYFDIEGGAALGFLDTNTVGKELVLTKKRKGYASIPSNHISSSWKGMSIGRTGPKRRSRQPYHLTSTSIDGHSRVEIDWMSPEAGTIDVSRNQFLLQQKAQDIELWIAQQVRGMYQSLLDKTESSQFSYLNRRIVLAGAATKTPINWIHIKNTQNGTKATWKPVLFPAISSGHSFLYRDIPKVPPKWNGRNVSVVQTLPRMDDSDPRHHNGISLFGSPLNPDRIAELRYSFPKNLPARFGGASSLLEIEGKLSLPKVIPLWAENLYSNKSSHVVGPTPKFPVEWSDLCGIEFDGVPEGDEFVWNCDHILLKSADTNGWNWVSNQFKGTPDPLPYQGDLLLDKGKASSWLLHILRGKHKDLWDGLKERAPDFLPKLWELLFDDAYLNKKKLSDQVICLWVEAPGTSRLRVLRMTGWDVYDSSKLKAIRKYMPTPNNDSIVHVEHEFGHLFGVRKKRNKR